MQIGKAQPNVASDHQIRTVAMQIASSKAVEGTPMPAIIGDAKNIEQFIKWGTTPAEQPKHK